MRAVILVAIAAMATVWIFRTAPHNARSWIQPVDPYAENEAGPAASGPDQGLPGYALFRDNCQKCHHPNLRSDLTGPALAGVTERVPSREWLYDWIGNAMGMVKGGDSYANKLYKDWNKIAMDPMPHLSREEIGQIIDFIESAGDGSVAGV